MTVYNCGTQNNSYPPDNHLTSDDVRVRMIPVMGYWVLGNIQIFDSTVIGGIFFVVLTPNTIPIRQQSALSTCQWTII